MNPKTTMLLLLLAGACRVDAPVTSAPGGGVPDPSAAADVAGTGPTQTSDSGDAAPPADAKPADGADAGLSTSRPTDGAKTLVVVTTADWDATDAQLRVYHRDGDGWAAAKGPIAATVGHAGLRWGRGLHALPEAGLKQEGDGASPAGIFRLPGLVGTTAIAPTGAQLPYQHAGPALRCVDDPVSPSYNDLIDEPAGGPPWSSAEVMARPDGLYDLIVTVDHNGLDGEAVPGGGSCIFIHRWSAPGSTTVGCTALAAPDLAAVVAVIGPPALLITAPEPVLERLAAEWGAPWPLAP